MWEERGGIILNCAFKSGAYFLQDILNIFTKNRKFGNRKFSIFFINPFCSKIINFLRKKNRSIVKNERLKNTSPYVQQGQKFVKFNHFMTHHVYTPYLALK